jgi:hypothetical protein
MCHHRMITDRWSMEGGGMNTRRVAVPAVSILLLAILLACRVGTPTPTEAVPTSTPTLRPTSTPLPTITPLPSPTPLPGNAYILEKAKVDYVDFFEGGAEAPAYGERVYAVKFAKSSSRYIYAEINLSYPSPPQRVDFIVDTRWYDPAGQMIAELPLEAYVDAGWTSSAHAVGRGWDKPGKWIAGKYKVESYISGQLVASGSFEVD